MSESPIKVEPVYYSVTDAESLAMITAIKDDRMIGFLTFQVLGSREHIYIHELWVEVDERRKGLATRLLSQVEEIGKGLNKYMLLSCERDNAAGNLLYKSLGWRRGFDFEQDGKEYYQYAKDRSDFNGAK